MTLTRAFDSPTLDVQRLNHQYHRSTTLCQRPSPTPKNAPTLSFMNWRNWITNTRESTRRIFRGSIHGLPRTWACSSNVGWVDVTSHFFHAPFRHDVQSLRHLSDKHVLLSLHQSQLLHQPLLELLSWFTQFEHQFRSVLRLQALVQDERRVYDFHYRIHTEYDGFWHEFKHVLELGQELVDFLAPVMTTAKGNNPSEEKFVSTDSLVVGFQDQIQVLCDELEACLDDEARVQRELLQQHFNESDEHESILAAIAWNVHHQLKESLVIEKLVMGMSRWTTPHDRECFVECLPGTLKLWMKSRNTKKELDAFEQILPTILSFSMGSNQKLVSRRPDARSRRSSFGAPLKMKHRLRQSLRWTRPRQHIECYAMSV